MFYTIYKITNKLDGKIYIGKHQTKNLDDGYMGSGKRLKFAIAKHGIENFTKEIIFQFDNESDMNAKEAELVTLDFSLREDTYNLCVGGQGGFSFINNSPDLIAKRDTYENKLAGRIAANKAIDDKYDSLNFTAIKLKTDDKFRCEFQMKVSTGLKQKFEKDGHHWSGKKHSEKTKKRISEANSKMTGSKNSQYGTMWITNGTENKKIKKEVDIIPEGWCKGRK
jgi:hypothetical protein